jgi:cell shape-determining protein MreC
LVGAVKSVHREGPGLFLSVSIAPAVDFRSLEQVLVVIEPPPRPVEEQIKDEQVKG